MKEITVVGAAIIEDGKLFVVQRSEKMITPLKWEFPGGKVEPGESNEEALKRELLEELNLEVEVKGFVAEGISSGIDRIIKLKVYEASVLGGQLKLMEHKTFEWVPVSLISDLDWPEADLPACRAIMEKYGD